MLSVIAHEAGHALTAMALGFKLKKFYLGIPFDENIGGYRVTTNLFRKQIGDVEFGLSALLLGGAVDFHDLDNSSWPKFSLVVAYGPVASLLLGFVPLLFFYDFQTAVSISRIIIEVVIASLVQVFTGGLAIEQVAGPVGATQQMVQFATQYNNGYILLLVVLNLAFFATNILPIPAIDGGHLLFSAIDTVTEKKYTKVLQKITLVSWYLLIAFMAIVMTKDLW